MKFEEIPAIVAVILLFGIGMFACAAAIVQERNALLLLSSLVAIMAALYISYHQEHVT